MKKILITLVFVVMLVAGLFAVAGSKSVDTNRLSADFHDSGFPDLIER
jgi:hypothetical protein